MKENEMANLGKVALAMLGILAYQNRDKLGALLKGEHQNGGDPNDPDKAGGGGLFEQITDTLGSGGGLTDILDRFRNAGTGKEVDSWVKQGPNRPIEPHQVEAAIDAETMEALTRQTGLSREELLRRIAHDLPDAVDRMTPAGRVPKAGEPTLLDDVPVNRTSA
jgi:uncharacterized protein YidB (DUF937 family)